MNFIEQHIGADAFNRLVEKIGGCDYKVPAGINTERGAQLREWIGKQAAQALIDYAAGDTVYIGARHEQALTHRYREIRRLHRSGLCPREIAQRYTFTGKYTERQIWAILAADFKTARKTLEQGDLFE
jgi:hypothetical protein